MIWSRKTPEEERELMVERQLRDRGIRSEEVLRVMGEVPREAFLPPGRKAEAYRDQALPLSKGQTLSQPYMVAVMTEALSLRPEDRVLEIGTGSGYQTTVLAELAAEVYTVERIESLTEEARRNLQELGVENVHFRVGDGTKGWPEQAPFQAILVTAGAPRIPDTLRDQLDPEGGRLVIPVGDRYMQDLTRMTRRGEEFQSESLLSCRFVPLLGEEGWEAAGPDFTT
jgi:protein-L-isoaspartate(D-aspartate) O-methyltransferase